jgi:3-oxoacyl-[acyl-carrier-protein] synthase II
MAANRRDADRRRVVIAGLGAVTPFGIGVMLFWEKALAGESGIRPVRAFDASEYTSRIAGEVQDFNPLNWVDKRSANRMDRFTQLAVASAHEAILDAGIELGEGVGEFGEGHKVPTNIDPERAGCIYGSGIGGLSEFETQHSRLIEKGPRRVSAFTIPKLMANCASGEISIQYGLKGPNSCVVTACASATHSTGQALETIRLGRADLVLTGGSEAPVTPIGLAGFCSLKGLSTRNDEPERASRPFDLNRDGFVLAEGAGAVVVEELEHAKRRGARIYAELLGFGMSSDAYHITQPCPDADGAVRAMRMAMEDAGLAAEDIDYVNAHGTSTLLNDKMETLAIKKVLGRRAYEIAVSSTKSVLGHSLGASGAIELAAVALGIREGKVHPTTNYETSDPECDLDYVPNEARELVIRAALSNSLGFGGHNATLAVARFEG